MAALQRRDRLREHLTGPGVAVAVSRASLPALAVAAALGAATAALVMTLARDGAAACPQSGVADAAQVHAAPAQGPAASSTAAAAPGVSTGRGVARGAGRGPDAAGVPEADNDQLLKDLLTPAGHHRDGMRGQLAGFLARHPGRDGLAVASRGVFELAGYRELLPDTDLAALYLEQEDPAFRRVLAQVASMRGDNRLVELHVAEAGIGLHSPVAADRQRALAELARVRHVAAADLAAPLLADPDTGVVLDALLALRASGNQRHLAFARDLGTHPDPAVRWLAGDVADGLRMLSEHARTRVDHDELAAALPQPSPPPAEVAARCSRAGT